MAAKEDLTLRMRSSGGRSTSRDVDRVGRSVRGVGNDSKGATKHVSLFSRALTMATTRGIIFAAATVAIGAASAGAFPALILLTGAMLALGAILLPVGLLAFATIQRFQDTVGIAGSAASDLAAVFKGLKSAFEVAVNPAASIILRALADTLQMLQPVLMRLEGPLTAFATVMAGSIKILLGGLIQLEPQLHAMIATSGTLLPLLSGLVVALTSAFVDGAIAGGPAAAQILRWLTDFSWWLKDAIGWMVKFAHSQGAINAVGQVFHVVATAARWLWSVVGDLAGILYQVYMAALPVTKVLGGAALVALQGVATALDWVNRNFNSLKTVLVPLTVGVAAFGAALWATSVALKVVAVYTKLARLAKVAYTFATKVATIAIRAFTIAARMAALAMSVLTWPITLVVAALAGLVLGFKYAYNHSTPFRNAVDSLVTLFKTYWTWVGKVAFAMRDGLGDAFSWVAKKAQWLWDKLQPVLDAMKKVAEFSPAGLAKKATGALGVDLTPGFNIPGLAGGGTVHRGGAAMVGERGPEIVHLPTGSMVEPNGGARGGDIWVASTLVMPDGEVVAKATTRAAKKKKATR